MPVTIAAEANCRTLSTIMPIRKMVVCDIVYVMGVSVRFERAMSNTALGRARAESVQCV